MKKTVVLILCLVFLSLACLETVAVADHAAIATAATFLLITPDATLTLSPVAPTRQATSAPMCARVTAIEALHLRTGANEHAIVLTWLKHGDLVQVIDQSDGDWWFVESSTGRSGYARSVYLQESECA
jgi:uncharacterized protein YgiM (DUF1202 family)